MLYVRFSRDSRPGSESSELFGPFASIGVSEAAVIATRGESAVRVLADRTPDGWVLPGHEGVWTFYGVVSDADLGQSLLPWHARQFLN